MPRTVVTLLNEYTENYFEKTHKVARSIGSYASKPNEKMYNSAISVPGGVVHVGTHGNNKLQVYFADIKNTYEHGFEVSIYKDAKVFIEIVRVVLAEAVYEGIEVKEIGDRIIRCANNVNINYTKIK